MKVIGIVGGIGAGKSTVVELMNKIEPMNIISADLVGHEVLLKGGKAYSTVIETFGEEILDKEGNIVRRKLGEKVFGDKELLQVLNSITHPCIIQEIQNRIEHMKRVNPEKHILLESALLIESGLVHLTDLVVAVYASSETRINRVMLREGFSEKQIKDRFSAQKKWEELKEAADYIIDNGVSLEETEVQIKELLERLE